MHQNGEQPFEMVKVSQELPFGNNLRAQSRENLVFLRLQSNAVLPFSDSIMQIAVVEDVHLM